jgi:hypothetical protein
MPILMKTLTFMPEVSFKETAYNENIVLVKFDTNGNLIFKKEFVSSRQDKLYTVSYNQNQVYIGVGMLLVQIFLP